MSLHTATIHWQRAGNDHPKGRHGTAHLWRFDGGAEVAASASTHVLDPPYSTPANVDPEEALVAAVSSCHMLFYLWFAHKEGYVVSDYSDTAEGTMAKNQAGRMAITHVRLNPRVRYAGSTPDRATEIALHEKSHEACFIANSINATIETVLEGDSA